MLFGEGVVADELNDDALARALDKLHEATPWKVYSTLAMQAMKKLKLRIGPIHRGLFRDLSRVCAALVLGACTACPLAVDPAADSASLGGVAYVGTDEVHQWFTGDRTPLVRKRQTVHTFKG